MLIYGPSTEGISQFQGRFPGFIAQIKKKQCTQCDIRENETVAGAEVGANDVVVSLVSTNPM